MRPVLLTLLTVVILVVAGAFTFIYAGVYDVSATRPHWPITYWVMETVRMQSVRTRAAGIVTPADLADPARTIGGTEHFAAHCASCHGAPGVPRGDIANGLYPRPADLTDAAKRYAPNELFWILKNGIKMSGMPAWADHGDEELWDTVAFIEKLPAMSDADYAKLIMASMMRGGGRHNHGGAAMPSSDSMPGMDHNAMPDMKGMDHSQMPGMAPPAPVAKRQ
jgi:mono/diheme cytochrome c family protein